MYDKLKCEQKMLEIDGLNFYISWTDGKWFFVKKLVYNLFLFNKFVRKKLCGKITVN